MAHRIKRLGDISPMLKQRYLATARCSTMDWRYIVRSSIGIQCNHHDSDVTNHTESQTHNLGPHKTQYGRRQSGVSHECGVSITLVCPDRSCPGVRSPSLD